MAAPKKVIGKDDFVWVRSIFGKGPDAQKQYKFIPDGGMNSVIKSFHEKQPEREFSCATPSRATQCPRSVWLQVHGVERINNQTWAVKQRMMLGRQLEDMFAMQADTEGILIKHWKDNPGDVVEKFKTGEGDDELEGVPDYFLQLDKVSVSDAKTSRSDSFGYVPIKNLWDDYGWFKYKVQVELYYYLCHKNAVRLKAEGLPLPEQCHLFSYALDDGLVRREITWTPTEDDLIADLRYVRRFNAAMRAETCPDCTCADSPDGFEVKFCLYGVVEEGSKVATSCCGDNLISKAKDIA